MNCFQGLLTYVFNQGDPLYHYDPLSIRGESLRTSLRIRKLSRWKQGKKNGNGRRNCDIPSSRWWKTWKLGFLFYVPETLSRNLTGINKRNLNLNLYLKLQQSWRKPRLLMFIPSLFSRFLSPCVKVPCEGQWHAFHGRFHRTVPSRFRCRCFFMCKEALSSEEDSRKGTLIKLVRRIRLVYVFWEANSFFQKSFKRFSRCPCSARLVTCATSRVPLCACTQQWPCGGRTVDPLPPPESWPHLSQGLAALKWLPPLNYKENYVKHRNWVKRGAVCSPSVM